MSDSRSDASAQDANPAELLDFALAGDAFLAGKDEPQEWLIDGLFPHPSAGMLWGWRGLGKTMSAISLATAVASGGVWLGDESMRARKKRAVLYLDFEMSKNSLRRRFRAATGGKMPSNLIIVPVEEYAKAAGSKPNLATAEGRALVVNLLKAVEARHEVEVELLLLDNWVSSIRGVDENDNAALGEVVNWMTRIRASGTSILFLHHASKNGVQRGASAREDLLDYVVALEPPKNWKPYGPAHFIVNLEKTREQPDSTVWCEPIEAKLKANEWQVASAAEVRAEDKELAQRQAEKKILRGLAQGVAPANALPLLNGKVRSALLEGLRERGLVARKDPSKERSPWTLTERGRKELTTRDQAEAAVVTADLRANGPAEFWSKVCDQVDQSEGSEVERRLRAVA